MEGNTRKYDSIISQVLSEEELDDFYYELHMLLPSHMKEMLVRILDSLIKTS